MISIHVEVDHHRLAKGLGSIRWYWFLHIVIEPPPILALELGIIDLRYVGSNAILALWCFFKYENTLSTAIR
jgi:hypothetical protein